MSRKKSFNEKLKSPHVICIEWSTEDVSHIRPDLTEEQAIEVLEMVKAKHDATIGINWEVIEIIAEDMYPQPDKDK